MESDKESKDLESQQLKAEALLISLSLEEKSKVSALLELQKARNLLYLAFTRELKQLEQNYENQYVPLFSQRAELLKSTNGFWLKAIHNNTLCSSLIYPKDEKVLNFLADIKCITDPNSDNFILEFYFNENPYIENDILRKKYVMTNADVMERGVGTEIRWKGENLLDPGTTEEEKQQAGSFFKFFNNINMPTKEQLENLNESMEQELVENVEQDYDIANEFKEEIVPNAALYYFGARTDEEDKDLLPE